MKVVSTVVGILLLFCCLGTPTLFANGDERAAELNDQYSQIFTCVREVLQSHQLYLPPQPFCAVEFTGPLACTKIYLQVDVSPSQWDNSSTVFMLRKNLFKIINRIHESLCDAVGNSCCAGMKINFHPPESFASNAPVTGNPPYLSVCVSKYDAKKLIAGRMSIDDLLNQPFTVLHKNGKRIEIDQL